MTALSSVAAFIADTVSDRLCNAALLFAKIATSVEIVIGRAADSFIIHLINHSGGLPERLIDSVPIRGRLHIPSRVVGVTSHVQSLTGSALAVEQGRDGLVINVEVGALEVIRID